MRPPKDPPVPDPDTRALRVLIADDDEDDYILTRDLLLRIGRPRFQLDWTPTYEGALEAIERNQHDVYLFDYHLGHADGLQLMREALARGCKAPIILLTGNDNWETDVEAMKAGAADYLVKGHLDARLLERSIRYASSASARKLSCSNTRMRSSARIATWRRPSRCRKRPPS